MAKFAKVFDVYSRRSDSPIKVIHEIPDTTRTRIIIWCRDTFSNFGIDNFWQEILKILHLLYGRYPLYRNSLQNDSAIDDMFKFLRSCQGNEFLNFVEYIFRVESLRYLNLPVNDLVAEINELISVDKLPYYLTELITEEIPAVMPGIPNSGRSYQIKTVSYPKIIMKENEAIHQQVTVSTLTLLQRPIFLNANKEYLDAFEDYRKDDYGDCLTKCGSAFESVMKILCEKKKWKYDPKETVGGLVKIMLDKMSIENYFEPLFMIVATLRNKLSKSHGAGTKPREATRSQAEYALNATASAILFLTAEAGER